LNWFRPTFAVPVFALLLAVIGYQDHLMRAAREPQIAPLVAVSLETRGGEPVAVKTHEGAGFSLLVNVTPDPSYSTYTFDLYNPAGKLQWSRQIPASSLDEHQLIYIPGAGLEQGHYTLAVSGVTAAGASSKIDSVPIEVQIQK
jgi:hypothetical protein